jgi:hypothetical protein
MWAEFTRTKNGFVAEVLKELLNAEGMSVRVVPPVGGPAAAGWLDERVVYLPTGKHHVAQEILRRV